MPKKIVWSPQSQQDYTSILEYLENEWDYQTIQKFIDLTEELITQISINPKQFPIIQKKLKVRKCVITKHNTLFYRARKQHVDILRIFDTRQDPRKLSYT